MAISTATGRSCGTRKSSSSAPIGVTSFWMQRVPRSSSEVISDSEQRAKSRAQEKRERKLMRKKVFGLALSAMLFELCVRVQEQKPTKIPRIGYLSVVSLSAISARIEAFRQGLRELGYVEGKNIVIEWRSAEENLDRLPSLAAELVRLKVDIILTGGSAPTRAAKEATTTIPIVMTNEGDPVGSGFVASLARPGGNITGLSTLAPELSGKRLELLKEIIPKLSCVAVFR